MFLTGQGVVIERSPWSDRCFADAMSRNGYFTREGDNILHFCTSTLKCTFHLQKCIYKHCDYVACFSRVGI